MDVGATPLPKKKTHRARQARFVSSAMSQWARNAEKCAPNAFNGCYRCMEVHSEEGMSLVKCGECGNDISSEASSCPKCGWRPATGGGGGFLKWLSIVIVAVPVIAVATIWLRNKAVGPEGWLLDDAEKKIKAQLIDPSSFVMRSSYYVRRPFGTGGTLIALCGVFDAKNRMGGFTSDARFVALATSYKESFNLMSVNFEDAEKKRSAEKVGLLSPFEAVYWNENCVDAGHPALVAEKQD